MKKYLPFLSIALLVVACNSKPDSTSTKSLQSVQQPVQDTAGLAEFKQWKAQSELASAQPQAQQNKTVEAAPTKTIVREVHVVEKPAPTHKSPTALQKEPKLTKATEKTLPATDNSTASGNGSGSAESSGSNTANAPATGQEAKKKEGWSSSAKGAVIGGVGGAVLGGVINKRNRAAGAVIGGVLGAGVGYGVGKVKDKKDNN